ncbi:asparagine synthase (glutamine-hydrolyzing) [Bacillus sp. 491mf]|uniref:asparagine synthetase B family protein n=1 Tax=Bacillus sp. 491mf TaxID=1761755 RepID=UPI0008E4D51D|nr:asparagine synthase-related protein [Bacillus sp. 491mf]SFD13691.1 asparagine synthase (glutamine-hydrolyzing) [Bacillus sp. 491mf]
MSTIAGIVTYSNPNNFTPYINEMLSVAKHRGIHSKETLLCASNVALGQALLFTTPDAKYQKISYKVNGRNYFITFDGRLDYKENLQRKLGLEVKRDEPDAYLVVYAYDCWGEDFLQELHGDFALSIWDETKQSLLLGRDRVGHRHLFYYFDGSTLVWGSEIKQILMHSNVTKKLNLRYLQGYLLDNPKVEEATAYQGIYRLKAGHYLTLSQGKLSVDRYYHFKPLPISYKKESEYIEGFRHLFANTVHNQIRSDGAVGISLSGGLDSSSIFSTIAQLDQEFNSKINMKAYTYVFQKQKEANEEPYVLSALQKYPSESRMIDGDHHWNFRGDFSYLQSFDEPYHLFNYKFGSEILQVMKEDGVHIHMSGMYGDQVLHGSPYYLAGLAKKKRFATLLKELKLWRESAIPLWELFYKYTLKPKFHQSEEFIPPWVNCERIDPSLLQERFSSTYNDCKWTEEEVIEYFNFLIYRTGREWTNQYVAHANGMEVRAPFLDSKIMEYLAAVPVHLKYNPKHSKYILRESMKGILPEKIRTRTTKGAHTTFMLSGFKKEWHQISSYYHCPTLTELGLVNPKSLIEICEKYYMGLFTDFKFYTSLMRALSLEIWIQGKLDYL